ncbi:MAG TPA: hypothetical protein VIV66_02330 [Pyrinomonadaceae bacterium]
MNADKTDLNDEGVLTLDISDPAYPADCLGRELILVRVSIQ